VFALFCDVALTHVFNEFTSSEFVVFKMGGAWQAGKIGDTTVFGSIELSSGRLGLRWID
jgi:hypothetical protein